jgi:hypothetical protein
VPSGPFNQNCLQSRLVRLTAEAVRCLWSHQPLLVIQWCQSSDRQISDQSVLMKPELALAELGGQVIEDMAFHLPLPRPSVYEDGEKPPSAYITTLGNSKLRSLPSMAEGPLRRYYYGQLDTLGRTCNTDGLYLDIGGTLGGSCTRSRCRMSISNTWWDDGGLAVSNF